MRARRAGRPNSAQPVGFGFGHADRHHCRPVCGGGLCVCAASRKWTLCDRAVDRRYCSGVVAGTTDRNPVWSFYLLAYRYAIDSRRCTTARHRNLKFTFRERAPDSRYQKL